MALAETRTDWAVGFEDETWWSRLAHPPLHAWREDAPLRLVAQAVAKHDPDPKALACYGLLVRARGDAPEAVWLRFVDGRPVSALTTQFLAWCGDRLAGEGITTLVLVWDNASWHGSREVRHWLRAHNQQVHRTGGRAHRAVLPAEQESLAQPHRAAVGPRQAADPGTRPPADRRRAGGPRLRHFWLSAQRSFDHPQRGRLIMH